MEAARRLLAASTFEAEDCSDAELNYATREEGDVGECEPGAGDVLEARRLRREINAIPGVVAVVDVCDEWVSVRVSPSPVNDR